MINYKIIKIKLSLYLSIFKSVHKNHNIHYLKPEYIIQKTTKIIYENYKLVINKLK